jgi:hypothetical protein
MTVRFTCPRSDAIPLRQDTVVWARHGVIGGTAARSWGAYELAGEQWAWTIRHGSGCDPRQDVDALADALADGNLATVVLTPGTDYDSQEVADAIAAELLSAFGHTADVDSVTVDGQTRYQLTIAGAANGLVGSPSSTKGVTSQCGIHDGSRRDGSGAVTGTLYIHTEVRAYRRDGTAVPDGTRCRITGIGYFGIDSFRPRLGAALGPAHSLTPTGIGPIADAGRPASGSANGYDPIVAPLATAIACVVGDDAWILVCDAGVASGTLHYRAHASSGWHGDLGAAEDLLVEATRNDPDAAFPSSVSPTISANFAVHSMAFLVVECDDDAADDGSGFAGDGSIWCEIGCRRDAAGETPTEDEPADETFHYRMLTPPFSRAAFAQVGYGLAAVNASEDMAAAFYSWDILDLNGAVGTRLGTSGGVLGWDDGTPDTYNLASFARVPCGDDVVSDPFVSYGFTGGLIAGGAPTVLQIQFDTGTINPEDFGQDGERVYNQGASPDLLVSDHVVGGLRDLTEYQSAPTSTMPYNAPAGAWPASYDFAGTDARPSNLGRSFVVVAEQSPTADVFAVETTADGTTAEADVSLDATADAELVVYATASADMGLDAQTGAPTVTVSATATADVGLNARILFPNGGIIATSPHPGEDVIPMADLLELLRTSAAGSPRPLPFRVNLDGSPTSQAISGVPRAGALIVGGAITADDDAEASFYDGDPDDDGVLLCVQPLTGGTPFPLAVLGLFSSSGRAVWLECAGIVRGRALASEI